MYAGKKRLQGLRENDPVWIKELASHISYLSKKKITDEDKKLILELFFEYQREGLPPKIAIEKAKNIILSFNSNLNISV